jgi:hypothetical protein
MAAERHAVSRPGAAQWPSTSSTFWMRGGQGGWGCRAISVCGYTLSKLRSLCGCRLERIVVISDEDAVCPSQPLPGQ